MAKKFISFVVFATVAQASFAADVEAVKKITHDSWAQAVTSLYDTMEDPSVSLSDGQCQYATPATTGRQAFLDAAPQGKNQTLLDKLSALGQTELGLMFGGIEIARYATLENLTSTNTALDNNRKEMPLTEGVRLDLEFAESNASQSDALAAIDEAFDQYFNGMKALAEYQAGQTTEVDTSSETAAQSALSDYIDIMYDSLS